MAGELLKPQGRCVAAKGGHVGRELEVDFSIDYRGELLDHQAQVAFTFEVEILEDVVVLEC